jgi:predicted RNA binding protein YcfA (HicA-like mRNA interferase family)
VPKITPISWKEFERIIIGAGCVYDHTEGDHRVYKRSDLRRPIVCPMDDDVPVFIIKNNMKTLGLSRDQYFQLLNNK